MTREDDDFRVCTCIAENHDHKPHRCEEPPTIRGGICVSCRLWYDRHRDLPKGEK